MKNKLMSVRMLKLKVISILIFISSSLYSQSLTVTFTTVPITSGFAAQYNPKHVLAVWIETESGTFVSSIKVMAQERIGYLSNWYAVAKGNKVNAVTGATLSSHQTHTITWNCKNYSSTLISNGTYKLCVELTSGDVTGTLSKTPFTIASDTFYTGTTSGSNITGLSMTYVRASAVNDISVNNQNVAYAAPNPFTNETDITFYASTAGTYTIQILNSLGQILFTKQGESYAGNNTINLKTSDFKKYLSKGVYYCIITTKNYRTSVKIEKK
jgi:hypothetical protein